VVLLLGVLNLETCRKKCVKPMNNQRISVVFLDKILRDGQAKSCH